MIKYAQRGLVKGGKVSSLLRHLYQTLVVTYFIVICVVGFSDFFGKGSAVSRQKALQICMGDFDNIRENFNSKKAIIIGTSIGTINAVILILTFVSAKLYVRKRSKSNKTPAKFGRFRRNIFTYKQIVIIGLLNYSFHLLDVVLMNIFNRETFQTFRKLHFFNHILYLTLIVGVAIPAFILFDLNKRKPEFFMKTSKVAPAKTKFVQISSQYIVPRRDNLQSYSGSATRSHKFSFLSSEDEALKNCENSKNKDFKINDEDHVKAVKDKTDVNEKNNNALPTSDFHIKKEVEIIDILAHKVNESHEVLEMKVMKHRNFDHSDEDYSSNIHIKNTKHCSNFKESCSLPMVE